MNPTPAHQLYQNGDADAPECIKDGNGEVTLGLCRVCGRGEIELEEPCEPKTKVYQVNFEKHTVQSDPTADAKLAARISQIRDLTARVCALPDAACKTRALNQTVCDYLTATAAEGMRDVFAYLDRVTAERDRSRAEAAVLAQRLDSANSRARDANAALNSVIAFTGDMG